MSYEDVKAQINAAKEKAQATARRICGGDTRMANVVLLAARLGVIENKLAELAAEKSTYAADPNVKLAAELRDYWELVAESLSE